MTVFGDLEIQLRELRRVYIASQPQSSPPSPEAQELARAFIVFAHSEIEWFVEKCAEKLLHSVQNGAHAGVFGAPSLALLTFSEIQPLNGGTSLGSGKKSTRQLNTRFGNAVAIHRGLIEGNEGIRERNLARLLVPLGLDAGGVDPAWLTELDAFSSRRGALAHLSRSEARASHLSINPADSWLQVERVTWTGTGAGGFAIDSLKSLDAWVSAETGSFAASFSTNRLRSAGILDNIFTWIRTKMFGGR